MVMPPVVVVMTPAVMMVVAPAVVMVAAVVMVVAPAVVVMVSPAVVVVPPVVMVMVMVPVLNRPQSSGVAGQGGSGGRAERGCVRRLRHRQQVQERRERHGDDRKQNSPHHHALQVTEITYEVGKVFRRVIDYKRVGRRDCIPAQYSSLLASHLAARQSFRST